MTSDVPDPQLDLLLRATRKRTLLLVFLFGLWSLLIVLRLAQIMIVQRPGFISEMERGAWVQGTLPAVRGRLLDIDGRPLAWSSRHFRLLWNVPVESTRLDAEWRAALSALPGLATAWTLPAVRRFHGQTVVLREDLSPEEFRRAAEVTAPSRHTGLAIESYFVRHRHPDPRIRRIIGEVTLENGMEVGISGKELTQDSFLRGRPGIYRVMTNPQGEWVPETWKKIQEIQPGYDVYLPLRIQP